MSAFRKLYMDEEKPDQWLSELEAVFKHFEIKTTDIQRSALIVVDMQNFFLNESLQAYIPSSKAIIPKVNSLIDLYTEMKKPVIFTKYAVSEGEDVSSMRRWWDEILMKGDPRAELYPELHIPQNHKVIRKSTYDSFHNTDLKEILDAANISTVVITGVMTNLCCETTARSAFTNNYRVYFPIDGNATMNEDLHTGTLRNLAHGFAVLCKIQDIAEALRSSKKNGGGNDRF